MPRSRRFTDEDAAPVLVPRNAKPLVAVSRDRVRRLREHLVEALRDARALKSTVTPCRPPPPSGFAARVTATACSLCKGWCCRNGGNDGYIDGHVIERVRQERPDLDAGAVIRLYSNRVPAVAFEGSCIFHGSEGCALDRSLRADICNGYFCGGLIAYLQDRQQESPRIIVAGEGDNMRTSPVLAP